MTDTQEKSLLVTSTNTGQKKTSHVAVCSVSCFVGSCFFVFCFYQPFDSATFFLLFVADNRCSPVPTVVHASPDTSLAVEGTVVTYSCERGYGLQSDSARKSLQCEGREWKGDMPVCEGTVIAIYQS